MLMPLNSYTIIEKEWDEFRLERQLLNNDYMGGRDISWVSQVTPFIRELTRPGQLVFDPFAGLGTTLLGAGITGRRSAGFEVDEARFTLLQKRLEKHRSAMTYFPKVQCGNALSDPFPEGIDVIVTNPPYFHAGKQKRRDNIYGIAEYAAYLELMDAVLARCAQAIPPDGMMVVFCENIRTADGAMLPQAYDMCGILRKYCSLRDERIILYRKQPEPTYPGELTTNRAHEYVFIGLRSG